MSKKEIFEAARKLMVWAPGYFCREVPVYGSELEELKDCPFLSESYLYELLGKEDARTVRALLRQLLQAAGLSDEDVWTLLYFYGKE